ncbi:MAG: hypothetical protein SCABRO_03837 [Candidatus Scalindua brodae]|uniref:Uncharacterized protein n=1 Tax=Candidatus Scalindua brodae TaxID=237368 RepID=A0A0B0EAZ8_9BACT|nr:MAG: hypothetical protein SCABRO_03837 [Candidatus Scalindua brodae]
MQKIQYSNSETLVSSEVCNKETTGTELRHRTLAVSVLIMLCLCLSACGRFGPRQIPKDSFSYNEAIARSSNEQMLVNLVRLRYREVPVFLAVGSVLTQYFYGGEATANAAFGKPTADAANEIIGAGGRMVYFERPTITYSPLGGQKFTQQLLTPIPNELVFSLVQSGWPPDQLLMMSLERVNHLENIPFSTIPSVESLEGLRTFNHMVQVIIELSRRRSLEMQGNNSVTPSIRSLVFKQVQDNETQSLIDELKGMLCMNPDHSSFRVTDRVIGRKPDEVTIRVRSLLAMMGFLSRGIEIPAAHIEEKRVEEMVFPVDPELRSLLFPLRIHSSVERPSDAVVAVWHYDHWYYIKHSDHMSKQAFGLLTYLFQMQSPQAQTLVQ